ncbi:MAG: hypothetical protein IJO45_03095 [Oscillospiraceae bacterium]|nr:hypothetical protein [Oscillospiraceae bacterium]
MMYNRYIPQPDGSYRRNPVHDSSRTNPPKPQHPNPPPEKQECPPPNKEPKPCPKQRKDEPIGGFLRQLLPKDFDTGDLIVVLLLLLMAGDCEEDRNNALLTLALYFLM